VNGTRYGSDLKGISDGLDRRQDFPSERYLRMDIFIDNGRATRIVPDPPPARTATKTATFAPLDYLPPANQSGNTI
jgi:hypothetical protein